MSPRSQSNSLGTESVSSAGNSEKPQAAIRFHPEHIRQQVIKLFEQGCGYVRVAKALKIPTGTVRDWKRQFAKGCFTASASESLITFDESIKREAIWLRQSGHTWAQIKKGQVQVLLALLVG